MKKLVILLTFTLVVLSLHCYALHKRVAYLHGQCDREYARGLFDGAMSAMNGTTRILTNNLQSAFEKEVAP